MIVFRNNRVLVLDERHQVHVVLASDDEGARPGVTVGVWVFQDVEQIATLDVEDDVLASVPTSVLKRGPRPITRQPTPTKFPIKNEPEIIDFRPVL